MYMDRFKQKVQNCLLSAGTQAIDAGLLLSGKAPTEGAQIEPSLLDTQLQRVDAAIGLLQSALDNAHRGRNGLSGRSLDDVETVRQIARELDAEEPNPATWHDVVHFALNISRPRLRRAWNVAMMVLTEGA